MFSGFCLKNKIIQKNQYSQKSPKPKPTQTRTTQTSENCYQLFL